MKMFDWLRELIKWVKKPRYMPYTIEAIRAESEKSYEEGDEE